MLPKKRQPVNLVKPMPLARLENRSIIEITGADSTVFLQNLLTQNVDSMALNEARYAALLTPQGKIISDFVVIKTKNGLWLDTPQPQSGLVMKKLSLYKLRADVTIHLHPEIKVFAKWKDPKQANEQVATQGSQPHTQNHDTAASAPDIIIEDPRNKQLGWRIYTQHAEVNKDEMAFTAHRISLGIPQINDDFDPSDTFPHEANMDTWNGLSFTKGCYVGQEVVSRMKHRATIRKRIVPVTFEGKAPQPGSNITLNEIVIGRMGSSFKQQGLALVRIDRIKEAQQMATPVLADGVVLSAHLPQD